MKKKVSITIEESVHNKMREIALKEGRYVYDIYEELAREFIRKTEGQSNLDEI